MCSRNLDAVGELHHSLAPSLEGLEPVLVRDPREVCALLWVSGRTAAGFGVQMCPPPSSVPWGRLAAIQQQWLRLGLCPMAWGHCRLMACCWQLLGTVTRLVVLL